MPTKRSGREKPTKTVFCLTATGCPERSVLGFAIVFVKTKERTVVSNARWTRRMSPTPERVDAFRQLDIRPWHRRGHLRLGNVFYVHWERGGVCLGSMGVRAEADRVVLVYRQRSHDGNWTDVSYGVRIERTPCNLGGSRPWFICPEADCARRVAILYAGDTVACRHCHRLVYPSTRQTSASRAMRRADALRARLGWNLGVLNPSGSRPKLDFPRFPGHIH